MFNTYLEIGINTLGNNTFAWILEKDSIEWVDQTWNGVFCWFFHNSMELANASVAYKMTGNWSLVAVAFLLLEHLVGVI